MNLSPLATAGLVMIGLSQVSQAWTAIQPTSQETHFRVVQAFCKSQAQGAATSDKSMRYYIECMNQHAQVAWALEDFIGEANELQSELYERHRKQNLSVVK